MTIEMTNMDDQLKLLIALLEEEKAELQKLIAESLTEEEYLIAHYHSKALDQVKSRLWTLYNLEDKLYFEKDLKKRSIEGWQNMIASDISGNMKDFFSKRLEEELDELEALNQIDNPISFKDPSLMDEILAKLVHGKFKHFKLILKQSVNLSLSIHCVGKKLKVQLPYVKRHIKNRILSNRTIKSFELSGFAFNEKETVLIWEIKGEKDDLLKHLRDILSRIVFEIFGFREFNQESFLQYSGKDSKSKL